MADTNKRRLKPAATSVFFYGILKCNGDIPRSYKKPNIAGLKRVIFL